MDKLNAACECGHVKYEISGHPLFRVYCHCTICQKFNDAPFGDVVVYKSAHVSDPEVQSVEYMTLKPPQN